MSRDISPEQDFQSSISLGDSRFYHPNFRAFDTGADLRRNHHGVLDNNKSSTQPCPAQQLIEDFPEMLRQLHSFEPLCTCEDQRKLARKAIAALKNRQNENFRNLANRLADDIAGVVD